MWGNGAIVPPFLTLTVDGCEWSALPRPSTYCTGSWVGLVAGMDVKEKRTISFPYQNSKPDLPVVQPAT
jgi:hypothetical protein